ncbi:DUF2300 domain-containing protein [Pseudoduganella plicata]|uniref:DUF2300 domain-containing protein n=1 Tax=Pseudoduganella plicata TaxID=321984 RepID=A0A4P7BI46_9BURK|nr:DUF2300 domain-containing protein [Pseudoduganella plicata]QBQ37305.1 DUF2300 domain-containing protein [Pseudoduganella plicata]GGZ11231.1 hypothetical protein GCM10007388_50800 [Pseudoduganella plicata]
MTRRGIAPAVLALPLLAAAVPAPAASLDVAWRKDGVTTVTQLHQGGAAPRPFDASRPVPLGSLWKLFVYIYAVDTRTPMPDYRCGGRDPEEVYCCEPGQTIARDAALAQSCGPFFEPRRLKIPAATWRNYWTDRLAQAPAGEFAWLADPSRMQPGRLVRLDNLLQALGSVPATSRAEAESALLRVVLDGRGADTVRWFGSQLRVKTFSWHEAPQRAPVARRLGGAAGWLADGTPVWFAGQGASSGILRQWAPQLAAALPPAQPEDSGCVMVDFFARYPVRSVRDANGVSATGALNGRFVVRFDNDNTLALRSAGELTVERGSDGRPQVRGRFGVNEYVARVVDREGSARDAEAAKALAVAARSYLQQNARLVAGCQQIADSSAAQRVSPNPASAEALAIARWTDQLIVDGVTVRYHSTKSSPGTLAWAQAVTLARQGKRFDELLALAYPGGAVAVAGNSGARCERLAANEAWLARALPRWRRLLITQGGYEAPAMMPVICALSTGMPYSEQSRNRIYMRPLSTREDRITLAHEYLHIGLRQHPRGQDEEYVEQLARRLVDMNLETL